MTSSIPFLSKTHSDAILRSFKFGNNLNKFVADLTNQKYTDIEIELVDETSSTSIRIKVHRTILAFATDYFDRLFQYNSGCSTITCLVPDAIIASNIIKSLYGIYPDNEINWPSIYHEIKCRDQWLLPIDLKMLYDVVVPPESYDELLETVDLLKIDILKDHLLLDSLKRNLPINYNQNDLPTELITEWKVNQPTIVVSMGFVVKFINIYTKKVILDLKISDGCYSFVISQNQRQFLLFERYDSINYFGDTQDLSSFSLDNGGISKLVTNGKSYNKLVAISPNGKYYIVARTNNLLDNISTICLYEFPDTIQWKTTINHCDQLISIAFTIDNKKIVFGCAKRMGYSILVFDTETGTFAESLVNTKISSIIPSNSDADMCGCLVGDANVISLVNIKSKPVICDINRVITSKLIRNGPKAGQIAYVTDDGVSIFDVVANEIKTIAIEKSKYIVDFSFNSNNILVQTTKIFSVIDIDTAECKMSYDVTKELSMGLILGYY